MIDIHCHILPGIDDGASNEAESLAMLQTAVDEGIHTIVATPHYISKYPTEKQRILSKVEELNRVIETNQLPINILPGQEIRAYGELLEDYEAGKLLAIGNGSRYILLEFSASHVPRYAEKLLYNMEFQGLKAIIAHPERNAEMMENPDKLYKLVEKGALTQITAASVIGLFGKKIQAFTHQIIEANLAHVIASDAHNTTSRGFVMKQAFAKIEGKYGNGCVRYLQENAQLILENQIIYPEQFEQIKKKKFLGIF